MQQTDIPPPISQQKLVLWTILIQMDVGKTGRLYYLLGTSTNTNRWNLFMKFILYKELWWERNLVVHGFCMWPYDTITGILSRTITKQNEVLCSGVCVWGSFYCPVH